MPFQPDSPLPHIVVLGAGFGGLLFCQSLRGQARITLVDRHNHHAFQPLLYQVATAGLSAPEVAAPIRSIFRRDPRVTVLMETVHGIDLTASQVRLTRHTLRYDALLIALGGQTSYFGKNAWRLHAPGLKSVGDAMAMRSKLLGAFEKAENSDDPEERRRLTTVVVIGGGPTGVELAGAVAELTRVVFRRDFRHLDTTRTRVLLIEGSDRLLRQFPDPLPAKALAQLASLGVEVMLEARVANITAEGVTLADGRTIESQTVLWGAGVQANDLTAALGVPLGPGGRIQVEKDLSLPGHPNVFAVGDIVALTDARGVQVPGLAPAAMQMGRHVARILSRELATRQRGDTAPDDPATVLASRPAFTYFDKGSMATIGRRRAIAQIGRLRFSGYFAWLAWTFVHLMFLVGFRNKVAVFLSWTYSYYTFRRGARIIIEPESPAPQEAPPASPIPPAPSGTNPQERT